MTNRKASLSKTKLLTFITIIGISAISATSSLSYEDYKLSQSSNPRSSSTSDPSRKVLDEEELYDQIQDEEENMENLQGGEAGEGAESLDDENFDFENDPFLAELLEEALSELENENFEEWKSWDEDWDFAFSEDEGDFPYSDEEESLEDLVFSEDEGDFPYSDDEESLEEAKVWTRSSSLEESSLDEVKVWTRSSCLDKRLLPLNEYVYSRQKDQSGWATQVTASTTQSKPTSQPVVLGNLSKESKPSPRKPTGMKIEKRKKSIESGQGSVATHRAKVKMQEIIEFGLSPDIVETSGSSTPFSADDLNPESRKNIFLAWKSNSENEPSFYALDDGIDPFDEAAQVVNETVFGYQSNQNNESLVAMTDEPMPEKLQAAAPSTTEQLDKPDTKSAPAESPPDEAKPTEEKKQVTTPQEEPDQVKTPPPTTKQEKEPEPDTKTERTLSEPVEEEVVKEQTGYLVKFNNARMSDYLGFISKITGKNFIFDPVDLDFRVTIVSNEPTSIENVMAALLQELRFRGLNMVEVGNNIIIHKELGINSPARVFSDSTKVPKDFEIFTQVYRLLNADPSTMAEIIRPMLSESAVIESIPDSGHLIVTGLRSNIERITELINSIDSPEAGLEVGQYQAQNLPISQAISIAQEMLTPIARDKTLVLTPLSSKNLVYIVTTPPLMIQALKIFQQIDRGEELPRTQYDIDQKGRPIISDEDVEAKARVSKEQPLGSLEATKFYIHKLQYRKGDQIQQALHAVAESLEDIQVEIENYNFIATINSVQWIESTNSLIFTGTTETLEKMRELVDELDTSLPQVLIEILVIEVTVEDSLTFSVDFGTRFGEPTSAGAQAFLQDNSPLTAALDTSVPGLNLDASGLARQAGFNLGVIGRTISRGGCDFNTMAALVRALHTDRRIDILLNPKIVVEDNAVAEFFVGINAPFQTQSIANDLGTVITSNFEFRDIGSTIKITPLIGNNGIVTLDIEQEISSVAAQNVVGGGTTTGLPGTAGATSTGAGIEQTTTTASTTNIGPTTRKSTTKTRVHMPDGYFLILSGQIRDEKDAIRTQVPCLGGIPWLGAFFSSTQNAIAKSNLMIFISPKIVDIERINPITKRQQDIWNERKRLPKRWEYEVDQALQWFNVKDPYCAPEMSPLRE